MVAGKSAILRYRIIDRCIRSKTFPYPSKEELRNACEEELFGSVNGVNVCDSTIEKDLYSMRVENDAPIKYSRRHNGYFYADPEFTINEIPLNEKDIDAIKIAANILDQFKNSPMFQQFDGAISKILDRVNISSNANDKAVDSYVQFESVKVAKGGEFLEELLKAIKSRKKIQFEYQSFNQDEKSIRRVHPYLLKEYRHRWYLIGNNEMKSRIQTFGLDRLFHLSILEDGFEMDSAFDADRFFKYSIGITANVGAPEKIVVETNDLLSKYLISQPLHFSQEYIGESNGVHQFKFFLLPTFELKMQILGFGKEIKVLSPDSLVRDIKDTALFVANQY